MANAEYFLQHAKFGPLFSPGVASLKLRSTLAADTESLYIPVEC